ncbi:MAG: adenosine deaminase [Thermodesulfobacteriota bacterium]|nr:adenosine deaminase [Thermodesulfobacteriota bacterium]
MKQLDKLLSLPKSDLHVHLNGAIPTHTAKKLLAPIRGSLPDWFTLDTDLQINSPVNGLQEYFKPWYALKKLPYSQDCLNLMVESALEGLANDNVLDVELRNSPFNMSEIKDIPLTNALHWLIDSIENASVKIGIDAKLVLSLSRYNLDKDKIIQLEKAIRAVKSNDTLVGVDLSGNEDSPIVPEVRNFFIRSKHELGLRITIHAGETAKIENILWAIEECEADRISHGLAAANSENVMSLLIDRDICLEICLSSNFLTRSVTVIEKHPIHVFIKHGVPFVLCSDNPCINMSTLISNYNLFCEINGNIDLLNTMYVQQQRYSFKSN